MAKKNRPFPSREEILSWMKAQATPPSKRDVAKAFNIKGDDRIALKALIREMQQDGAFPTSRERREKLGKRQAGDVRVLEIAGFNTSGELLAYPIDEASHDVLLEAAPFTVHIHGDELPQPKDRILARVEEEGGKRTARVIRILPEQLTHILGIFKLHGAEGVVEPVDRRIKEEFSINLNDALGAKDGELLYCKIQPSRPSHRKFSMRPVVAIERVGRMDNPRSASIIAIHNQDIPIAFSGEALRIAESAQPPVLTDGRVDLRDIPLVTIDGSDARDFDDAVWAERDGNLWHLVVAIADVAHYVRFGTALDNEAFQRGNSVYFPDRVVPMLPEALSNGLCSLNPNEDRYCLAVHLWIDDKGLTKRYQFVRGLMRSRARLTYEQVQAAKDGEAGHVPQEVLENTILPLYGVYEALNNNRAIRGALELDLPEHKVQIDMESGKVASIGIRERFDSHKLIEECMIAANVAAAHAIEEAAAPGMFRVHESPDFDRMHELRLFLKQMGYHLVSREEMSGHDFNKVLNEAEDKPEAHVIHMAILRSQMAAYYHPKNLGHFGLQLAQYCHFTSPIRRYSDLIVHRTLIHICEMCDKETDELKPEQAENLNNIATHISQTERRAMLAEREAKERYIANFMADSVGQEFDAIIASVNSFGFFAELQQNGAQGLVPARTISGDFWIYDRERSRLVGRSTGEEFSLGQRIRVILQEADTLTGSLRFALVGREMRDGRSRPQPSRKQSFNKGFFKKGDKDKSSGHPHGGSKRKGKNTTGRKKR